MSDILARATLALVLLAGCTGRETRASAAAPVYPYWPAARLPQGPQPKERLPSPTASAVLIAPGYLLTSTVGMGEVADDFGLDPTVYVFDGSAWHVGRYVDRDKALRVALIRADVPGTPVSLPHASVRPARTVGIAPFAPLSVARDVREWRGEACEETRLPEWLEDQLERDRGPALCEESPVRDLPGALMVDAQGAFAGIQVNPSGAGQSGGPDATEIRAYLDLYFSTWGEAVRPKPKY